MKHNFRKLEIWNRSMRLSIEIHNLTKRFPSEEQFASISQMRRAAVSVHSNIAEGSGRRTNKDFARFLHFSMGSLCELESQIIYANKFKYVEDILFENFINEINEIQKMIRVFEENLPKDKGFNKLLSLFI